MTIFGELLEIWGSVEIMRRHLYDLISCTTRLLIKSASFAVLAVLYTWSWERPQDVVQWLGWTWTFLDVYLLCACFFALPYVFFIASAMFPSISIFARNGLTWRPWQAFRRFWWPATRTFVGKNMLVTERLSWRYQLFWIALLSIKFWCSYEFQVKPLVAPTIELLFKEPLDSNPLFPGFNLILVPLLWLPFIFVYSLDAQIWYAIWTAIVGAAVGMASRLGEVADFSILSERILDAPRLFVSRILTRDDPESTDLKVVSVSDQPSLEPLLQGSSSSVLVQHMMFHNEKWHAFAVAWNDIIDGMRGGDLLNNSERDLLLFRFFSTSESPNQSSPVSERPYYLPLFLMAGSIDDALSKMSQLGSRFRALQADAVGEAAEQLHSFANYFVSTKPRRALMLESLVELWELSQWLVLGLLGDRHAAEMRCIVSLLTSYSASGKLLSKVTVENLESVKVALLDLIRIMRIARTTYKKRSQQSDNKADIAVKVTEKATSNQVVSELSGLRKIPSIHTLSLMEKFSGTSLSAVPQPLPASASQFVETDKDLSMIRERLEKLLNTVANVLRDDKKEVTLRFKTMLAQPNGFFWDASYATGHVLKLVNQPSCALILESMYVQLTVAKLDAQPSSVDASRRLLFFMNSLFMQMPRAPAVDSMKSLSVLTPFYSEDVAYSNADLLKENEDGVSNMSYLQSIYPVQWRNFLERVGELDTDRSLILNSSKGDEARKWASHRGQTLRFVGHLLSCFPLLSFLNFYFH
jgi:callose synthase